jgi:tetratricopeptide (TPR) repeat protein
MEIWNILGIDPTRDRNAITAAYREKLTGANPEDNPEGFKALRAAYEQALALAKQAEAADGTADTEAGRWAAQLHALYEDIRRRSSTEAWQALLDQDFCLSLLTRVQARDILLRYLEQHCFLPQAVWQQLDACFSLAAQADALRAVYSPDFIDNAVLAGIRNTELLPYALLEGPDAAACDDYLRAYARFRGRIGADDAEQARQALAAMEAAGARHPYTELCRAQLALRSGDLSGAEENLAAVRALLPDDVNCLLLDAALARAQNAEPRAEGLLRRALAQEPDRAQISFDLAGCLAAQEKYEEAKELYLALNRRMPYHRLVLAQLEQVNARLLPGREQRYAADPADTANALELGWCYHQLQREADAKRIADALDGALGGSADYENLAAKVLLAQGALPEALPHLERWEQALRRTRAQTPPAPGEDRLPEALRLQAFALMGMGRQPEAQALLASVLAEWPEDAGSWQLKAQQELRARRFAQALDAAERLRALSPGDPTGSYLCGVALFRLGRMQEAYAAFGAAMQLSGRDAGCLLFQCRILIGANQWDEAKKIAAEVQAAKISDPMLDYCLGRIASHEERSDDAIQHYEAVLPACQDADNPPDYAGEVFYRLACLRYPKADKVSVLALVDAGLRHDENSLSLLELRADLQRELNRTDDALATYARILELVPGHLTANESMGRLYQFRRADYAKAAGCYVRQLKIRETPVVHNLLGLCFQELARYADAERAFLTAIRLAPGEYAYRANLAEFYMLTLQYERAEPIYRDALALPIQHSATRAALRRQYACLLSRMGRTDDAVAVLRQNTDREYCYADWETIAEYCGRSGGGRGLSNPVLQALTQWRRLARPPQALYALRLTQLVLLPGGSLWNAAAALRQHAGSDPACALQLAWIYTAQGRYRAALRLYRALAKAAPGNDSLLSDYARCQLWSGDRAGAARTAAQGLAALEKSRAQMNAPLYGTRQAVLYLLCGDLPRAQRALDAAERAPLCARCGCRGCKDALAARGLLAELSGQREQAAALWREGAARYPEESDFLLYLQHMKRMKHA